MKAFQQTAAPKNRDAFRPAYQAFYGRRLFIFCCICNNSISQLIMPMVIYGCIYNNQPTNNTFVYSSNKSIYQASLSLLIPTILLYVKHI